MFSGLILILFSTHQTIVIVFVINSSFFLFFFDTWSAANWYKCPTAFLLLVAVFYTSCFFLLFFCCMSPKMAFLEVLVVMVECFLLKDCLFFSQDTIFVSNIVLFNVDRSMYCWPFRFYNLIKWQDYIWQRSWLLQS